MEGWRRVGRKIRPGKIYLRIKGAKELLLGFYTKTCRFMDKRVLEILRFLIAPPRVHVFPLSVRAHPRTVLSTNTSTLVCRFQISTRMHFQCPCRRRSIRRAIALLFFSEMLSWRGVMPEDTISARIQSEGRERGIGGGEIIKKKLFYGTLWMDTRRGAAGTAPRRQQ